MRGGALLRSLMLVIVMMLFVAACSSDEPASGPVTFKTMLNLSDPPVRGTFEVTTGADVLGCSSGTVVRVDNSETFGNYVMTCESGSNAGTFTIYHGGDLFVWNVLESSDDFADESGSTTATCPTVD